jgi:hypothetical protein
VTRDAPNAIAWESKQFTTGKSFGQAFIPSLVLMGVLPLAVHFF